MAVDISLFDGCRVFVAGDLMIDEYVWGKVDRISPEAPVQIVSVEKEEFTLGGAGNVVNNLAALGARVFVAGIIGTGPDGARLLKMFKDIGADTKGIIKDPERPTTRKTRIIAANQHVLRIDRETTVKISHKSYEKQMEFFTKKIPDVDVVLISDYGKGFVTRELIKNLALLCEKHGIKAIADPKGLDFSKYSGVTLITPNKKEAGLAAGIEIKDKNTLVKAAKRLFDKTEISNLLITCGKDGMVLFEDPQKYYSIPAEAKQVFDVSGAGDTVLSVLGLCAAAGVAFPEGAKVANTAAGIVVGKVGTATVSKKELSSALKRFPDEMSAKYKSLSRISVIAREIKKSGKKIVMTNGCFDLLHTGHLMLFEASKKMGDILIVAIDDDDSVANLKGPGRPVIDARQRVRILSALDNVDYVVIFSTGELDQLIKAIRPDILTKGSNYSRDKVEGKELVEKLGGKVALIPVTENISSTEIINHIRGQEN